MNMILSAKNIVKIEKGLSKKKVFRKSDKKLNKIIIDFSDDKTEFDNFLCIYEILKKIDVSIPKIYEVYSREKIIVMEDFGNNSFDKIFHEYELYDLLKLAIDNIIIVQNSITYKDLEKLEHYTFNKLKEEISEFVDYYIPFNKISKFPVKDFYDSWKKIYKKQNFNFKNFVHKDFEFINLIFIKKNNQHFRCGIIDFQSAFVGFSGWDLFSLLENPRINFTRKYNEDLIKYFYDNVNILDKFETFRRQYYILNLGRQTRLLGRWIKIYNNGNKEFFDYIDVTKKRILSCLNNVHNERLVQIYKDFL
tara:strand:- start:983 stop:1903 length:921 start_codon:yes stop_codon:yes gene_type:complete